MTEVATAYGAAETARATAAWRGLRLATRDRCSSAGFPTLARFRIADERAAYGLAETILHAAWRRAGLASAVVGSRDGHTYRIIYQGRPADGAGPDFRDAILLRSDGKTIHGDIEIHVRSGDWHSHGHSSDGAYNGVVLHVALEESGAPAQTSSGLRVPLLLLKKEVLSPGRQEAPSNGMPTALAAEPASMTPVPLPFLDMRDAGDEWFRNRVHGSALAIAARGVEQACWEGALECLGYPANKPGFRHLAERLDWRTVKAMVANQSQPAGQDFLESAFLWAAGFGERPYGAPALTGPSPEWTGRHGRPANRPETRVRAAATWVIRWSGTGGIEQAFSAAVRAARSDHELHRLFIVGNPHGKVALLGPSRAADIVVNHLLPITAALAAERGDTRLAHRAKSLFDTHCRLQSNNITREAAALLAARGQDARPGSAREQQGLIHIYRLATSRQQPVRQLPLL